MTNRGRGWPLLTAHGPPPTLLPRSRPTLRRGCALRRGTALAAARIVVAEPVGHLGVLAEEELLHLLAEEVARALLGEVQAIGADQRLRVLLPELERLRRDVLVDAQPELPTE